MRALRRLHRAQSSTTSWQILCMCLKWNLFLSTLNTLPADMWHIWKWWYFTNCFCMAAGTIVRYGLPSSGSYTSSPSCTVYTRGSCAHRSAHRCLLCSLTQSSRVAHVGKGGVRSDSASWRISVLSSISGVTLSFTYICSKDPLRVMPCMTQVSPADKKVIFSARFTADRIASDTSPEGLTQMRSTRSLGTRQANGVFRWMAARTCRQILSAGGAHMPRVYLSLPILLVDSESW